MWAWMKTAKAKATRPSCKRADGRAMSINARLRAAAPTSGADPCTAATSNARTSAKWPISTSTTLLPRTPYHLRPSWHNRHFRAMSVCITRDKPGITRVLMTRMTAKGQVTIPKRLRDYLGLKPGSKIEFIVRSDGQVALETNEKRPKGRFDALRGTLGLG